MQNASRFQPEGFAGEGGYTRTSGEYRDASMADEIEAGTMVMPRARRAMVVVVAMRIRCRQRGVVIPGIHVLRMAGCMVVVGEGVAVDTNHRRQQKGNGAHCSYASCRPRTVQAEHRSLVGPC